MIFMCGIVGFMNQEKKKEKTLRLMMESIKHRGLDGFGTYIDKNIALGHNRLAIIDLEDGTEPQYNEDKSIVLIFNGEIYNYISLRKQLQQKGHHFYTKSDAEVIIHGYEEWGEDTPKYLRGMFAFALYNKKNKELFLAKDPSGIKPLYYARFKDTFMFASEIKALLAHPDFEKVCNTSLLSSYLCFGFNASKETMFKHVFDLEPGTSLLVSRKRIQKRRYFRFEFTEEGCTVENIKEAMRDSVHHHLMSEVKVGSFLSSGIDSSYIASLSKLNNTYTVGYEQNDYNEITYAKELSNLLHQTNKSKIITKEEYLKALPTVIRSLDEPLADPSIIATYFCAELASQDVKVVLSGEGADELFGGYLAYLEELSMPHYMKIPFKIRRGVSTLVSLFPEFRGFNFLYRRGRTLAEEYIGIGRICRDSEACKLVKISKQIKTSSLTKMCYDQYQKNTSLEKRQMIDFTFYLAKDFLPAIDRATMLFGIEARTPFLDLEVFKAASALKEEQKINKYTTKVLLREAAKEVIPNEAYKKKKLGFPVPLKLWMKEDLYYTEIYEKFTSKSASLFFNQKKICKLLKRYKKGTYKNYKLLWALYVFIVWYDLYFK